MPYEALEHLSKAEALGVTLAQALYCKVPTVTFRIPASGVNYISPNGITGIEVTNGDAKTIDKMLSNSILQASLGREGRERVLRNFTMDIIKYKLATLTTSTQTIVLSLIHLGFHILFKIGNRMVITAGSIAIKDAPPHAIIAGIPVKRAKQKFTVSRMAIPSIFIRT